MSAVTNTDPGSQISTSSPATSISTPSSVSTPSLTTNPVTNVSTRPTVPPAPTSEEPPVVVTTVQASSAPPVTQLVTSIITNPPSVAGESQEPVTVIVTSVSSFVPDPEPTVIDPAASTPSTSVAAPLQTSDSDSNSSGGGGGLSDQGKTAVAVVVPVVVVALLLLAAIFLWRRRKQRKNAEEARRKEVEEYGFNPNNDPTLPVVGAVVTAGGAEMAEDTSGYRGWGTTTTTPSNRKLSTTLTGGITGTSDNGSAGYHAQGSPTKATSDGHSADPLMRGQPDGGLDGEPVAALGAAPIAGAGRPDIRRGPSNASSSYSGHRSDNSADAPIPVQTNGGGPHDHYDGPAAYYQPGPHLDGAYGANGAHQAAAPQQQHPVVRDVAARRNTRIENPAVYPQQGNSGIAQNF